MPAGSPTLNRKSTNIPHLRIRTGPVWPGCETEGGGLGRSTKRSRAGQVVSDDVEDVHNIVLLLTEDLTDNAEKWCEAVWM
jgi:hypothetical protein